MGERPTITAAIARLRTAGFGGDASLVDGVVRCGACGESHAPEDVVVHHVDRFEGETDPGDEAIVLGVECAACGARAVIVSAFGADADPAIAKLAVNGPG